MLLHLVDAGAADVEADLAVVEEELAAYGHGLEQRPRLVVLNKIELLSPDALEALTARISERLEGPVLQISAAMAQGLEALKTAVWQELGIA